MNPYLPPSSDSLPPIVRPQAELASLGQRLGGKVLDGLMAVLCLVPGILTIPLFPGSVNQYGETEPSVISLVAIGLGLLALFALAIYNWALIVSQGQTLGKLAVGSRIVKLDGSPVDFVSGIVLRSWVIGFVTGILNQCCLGWIVTLVDALFIFGPERRCLHDQIAGTMVVVVD